MRDWLARYVITYDGATLTEHRVHSVRIGVTGDHATSTSDITVHQQVPGHGRVLVTDNSYADTFVREAGRWRFATRQLTRRDPANLSWHRRE